MNQLSKEKQKSRHQNILKTLLVLFLLIFAEAELFISPIQGYVAVDTSANDDRALLINTQNHIEIDSNDRWWILYYNGTCTAASYSTTLTSWTRLDGCAPASFLDGYYGLSFKIVGTTIYTVGEYFSAPNYYLRFWNGTISGASITWNTTGVNIVSTASRWGAPSLDIGSDGKIWVSTVFALIPDFRAYYSSNGGKTWVSTDNDEASPQYLGSVISPMTAGKMMAVYHSYSIPPNSLMYSVWTGTWSAAAGVSGGGSLPNNEGSFDLTADANNADIQYAVWLDDTSGYVVRFNRYSSGWGTIENVTGLVDSTSYPSITYDSSNSSVYVAWIKTDVLYGRSRYSDGTWGSIEVIDNMTAVNVIAPQDLSGITRNANGKLVFSFVTGNAAPFNVTVASIDQAVPEPITPSGTLEISGLKCGDIWVTPDKTYLTVTATIQAQTAIQNVSVRFNDSLNVMQADYDNTTSRWNLSRGRDYVSLNPQATATSYYSASPNNYTLQVEFMFLANEAILDKNDVEVQYEYALQNGSVTTWLTNATMNIYNKGGATEYVIQNNAGFLPGGDVYSVYAKNSSSIAVNQTWVRLQHLHANFAVRLVLNSTNSGEDNLWQDFAHKGANEYYTNSTDWTIYYKIWYYDEHNGAWVQGWILSFVKQQGDIGSADEWTELNVTFYNGPNSEKTASQNMSAWVEREPEARVRLWLDLWFNKMNASSVHGARLNPMYFGIHYTGWALWGTGVAGQWEPMYKNESQAAAFDRLQDANGNENVTSPMLTCMKTEQILVMNDNTYALEGLSPLHYNYTIQIDNWDVLEPKLSPTRNMEGVNTPLIVEPLLPDKTASSFWAPIYAALASIGGWIFKAFSALAEIVWQAVRAQFPWFAEWVDNVNAALANGIEIANKMLSGIVEILKMVGGQVWIFGFITDFIQHTWELIYPILAPFTQNSTVWLTLLIIVFGILPIADNLSRGRWDLVKDDLDMVWGFMRTIIVGIYVIVTTLVGWIISALPL